MGEREYATVLFLLFCLSLTGLSDEKDEGIRPPVWLHSPETVRVQQVSPQDYPYLAQWVDGHAKPAQDYMVRLFDKYQVVILAEEHNVKEHKTFVMDLLPRLYHEAGVRCLGWEFSPYALNARLAELIDAPRYDEKAVLQFARDCSPDWNSQEHWDLIKAVWALNASLPSGAEKMRLFGLRHEYDFVKAAVTLRTKPLNSPESRASPEFQELVADAVKYDVSMAQQVQEQILEKGRKGLVFVGLGHDWTQYQYPAEVNFGITLKTMGVLLAQRHPDRVFQVRLLCSSDPLLMDVVMKRRNHAWVGFDMPGSPFANLLVPAGRGAPDVPWHMKSIRDAASTTPKKWMSTCRSPGGLCLIEWRTATWGPAPPVRTARGLLSECAPRWDCRGSICPGCPSGRYTC